MLTSPISITIAGTAHSLSRVNQDNFCATYFKRGANYEIQLDIRHSREKATVTGQMERHNMDLKWTSFDADGKPTTTQTYHVVRPVRGSDGALAVDLEKALCAFSTANVATIVGWES